MKLTRGMNPLLDFGSIKVPKGTLASYMAWMASVEEHLKVKRDERSSGGDGRWLDESRWGEVDNKTFCEWAGRHNDWVRRFYDNFHLWAETPPTGPTETLTPRKVARFKRIVTSIRVPVGRWSKAYFKARMEHAYEVMRGRENEGTSIGGRPLTVEQAGSVIWLFEGLIMPDELDLAVPKGHDQLCSRDEYERCDKCGPVYDDDVGACRKRGCPLREENE